MTHHHGTCCCECVAHFDENFQFNWIPLTGYQVLRISDDSAVFMVTNSSGIERPDHGASVGNPMDVTWAGGGSRDGLTVTNAPTGTALITGTGGNGDAIPTHDNTPVPLTLFVNEYRSNYLTARYADNDAELMWNYPRGTQAFQVGDYVVASWGSPEKSRSEMVVTSVVDRVVRVYAGSGDPLPTVGTAVLLRLWAGFTTLETRIDDDTADIAFAGTLHNNNTISVSWTALPAGWRNPMTVSNVSGHTATISSANPGQRCLPYRDAKPVSIRYFNTNDWVVVSGDWERWEAGWRAFTPGSVLRCIRPYPHENRRHLAVDLTLSPTYPRSTIHAVIRFIGGSGPDVELRLRIDPSGWDIMVQPYKGDIAIGPEVYFNYVVWSDGLYFAYGYDKVNGIIVGVPYWAVGPLGPIVEFEVTERDPEADWNYYLLLRHLTYLATTPNCGEFCWCNVADRASGQYVLCLKINMPTVGDCPASDPDYLFRVPVGWFPKSSPPSSGWQRYCGILEGGLGEYPFGTFFRAEFDSLCNTETTRGSRLQVEKRVLLPGSPQQVKYHIGFEKEWDEPVNLPDLVGQTIPFYTYYATQESCQLAGEPTCVIESVQEYTGWDWYTACQ